LIQEISGILQKAEIKNLFLYGKGFLSFPRSQTVQNELFCHKSGGEPLNIAHFILISWRFEVF